MKRSRIFRESVVSGMIAFAVAGSAAAESINIDLNTFWGGPSSAFGAASGQTGHWNSFDGFQFSDPPLMLLDLSGNATDVFASFPLTFAGGTGHITSPILPPDPSSLLDDYLLVTDIPERLRIDGLDPGVYDVYVYGASVEIPTTYLLQSGGVFDNGFASGGWNGDFEEGVNYDKFTFEIVDGLIDIDWVTGSMGGLGAISGVQIIAVPAPGAWCLIAAAVLGRRRRVRS